MKILSMLLLSLFLTMGQGYAADTQFTGRVLRQEAIKGVEIPCEDGKICFDVWFRWDISVDETLSGPPISGHVFAARIAHSSYVPDHLDRFKFFAIRPIDDAEKRRLLGADYLLVDISNTGKAP